MSEEDRSPGFQYYSQMQLKLLTQLLQPSWMFAKYLPYVYYISKV